VADARRTVLGENHRDTLIALNNVATVLRAQNKWQDAKDLYATVVDASVRTNGPSHPDTCVFRGNLGLCLTKLSEFDEAEKELLAAHSGLVSSSGADHTRTREITSQLIDLYVVWGKSNEAEKWRTESANPVP
jgi:hypothetical protein